MLDCTLRDGGYVNDWKFGQEAITQIKRGLEDAGIDIIELGFFRDEPWIRDRTVFQDSDNLRELLQHKKQGSRYSVMITAADPEGLYPAERLHTPRESGIDYIRVCIWKRLLKEHLEYCSRIRKQGYQISIQPTAVGQYSEKEFIDLLKSANDVDPYAFYIVDTWGTQSSIEICRYAALADRYLNPDIKIGYHGHNNKMQALSCAEAILELKLSHDVCIDASIMGMGRGVGNLQTEVIADYLNEKCGKHYDSLNLVILFEKWLKNFYMENPWGYSMYHYLSAVFHCSQDFATFFRQNKISENIFLEFLKGLAPHEKTVFKKEFVVNRLSELKSEGKV